MRCLACGADNRPGEMLCHACGDLLLDQTVPEVLVRLPAAAPPADTTQEIRLDDLFNTRPIPLQDLLMGHEDPVSLTIETASGLICSVPVKEGTRIIVGRGKMTAQDAYKVDLAEHSADDLGLSRQHAIIQIEPRSVLLVDLGSTNGTFLNGRLLEPNNPNVLHNGDIVLFGRLQTRVLFA